MSYCIEPVANGYLLTIQAKPTEMAEKLVFPTISGVLEEIERREQARARG